VGSELPALTVRACLGVPPLAAGAVIGGEAGLDARVVRWVAVIEWPVEDFVAPGEFVLTTGIGCDEQRLIRLAREIAEAGAAALCVAAGPGAPFAAVPDGLRAVAEEHGMPLVSIAWEVRFADILRALIDRLLAARYAATFDPVDQLPAGFTDALLDRDGMRTIAEALEGMIARPVLLLDAGLAVTAAGPAAREALGEEALAAQPAKARALPAPGPTGEIAAVPARAGLPAGLIAPAVAQGDVLGYVLAAGGGEPLMVERHALGHAAVAVAIETLRRRAAAEAEARARGDFLWELASGSVPGREAIAAKAMLLGYDLDRRYRVLLAEAGGGAADALDDVARRLRSAPGVYASRRGDRMLALVPEGEPPAALDAGLSWGIAEGACTLDGLADGLRRAERALRVGRALHGAGTVGDAVTLGPFLLLDGLAQDESACRTAAALLAPLEQSSLDLPGTLEVYLEENGNTTAAARRLFLNRHSLMYRLRKAEALTGLDLSSHEDRFVLELSLRLRRMAHKPG
jgi:PucR family transcriptional regulator, purine catabolism regulatory protein